MLRTQHGNNLSRRVRLGADAWPAIRNPFGYRLVSLSSTTPGQTQNLISKVQDVADTYLQTLQAASQAIGKDMNDPSMNVLMKRATSLAGVLTTLMRSLRVFN